MFDLQAFAREVHKNAVEHGWWENPRSAGAIRALIHSEWSEALEEERAGRPMVWHMCADPVDESIICEKNNCQCKLDSWPEDCPARGPKPEGFAVELIDGCIRILDWLQWVGYSHHCTVEDWEREGTRVAAELSNGNEEQDVGDVVDLLHSMTALAVKGGRYDRGNMEYYAMCAFGYAFWWIRSKGLSPETLIQQKHRYNRTRPYKHGKVF